MSRVIFDHQPSAPQFDLGRADVVCFVGLVRLLDPKPTLPIALQGWLSALGYGGDQITQITNVPVLLETYAAFTAIFDPGGSAKSRGTDYLAAAVRSFFAQGGRRCYVVRVGDPVIPSDDTAPTKDAADQRTPREIKRDALLPSTLSVDNQAPSWTGIANLNALQDVSFLVVPDLPVLHASKPQGAVGQIPSIPSGPEQFVECSEADRTPKEALIYPPAAPRLSLSDYGAWASTVASILNYLVSDSQMQQPEFREVQLVAALPLPQDFDVATAAENPSGAELAQDVHDVIRAQMPEIVLPGDAVAPGNISSAFLQLAYPWLKTTGSNVLLESLEPPDGALAGLLARNALTRGTFTSATKVQPAEIYDVWPQLPANETKSSAVPLAWDNATPKPLIERISLFGFTPDGLRLLSDVTAYPGESYRTAAVNRLVSVIRRAARHMGEAAIFENNGPRQWAQVQSLLQTLMTRLWNLNALDGATARDAFSVRCDRTTMTQNDLDNGRLLAEVTFTAASTIETIRVTLAMEASATSVQEISAIAAGVS